MNEKVQNIDKTEKWRNIYVKHYMIKQRSVVQKELTIEWMDQRTKQSREVPQSKVCLLSLIKVWLSMIENVPTVQSSMDFAS